MSPNMALWLERDGTVSYSSRVSATVSCPQDLAYYPMDRQRCSLKMMSYAHHDGRVKLQWFEENPIATSKHIELAEFVLIGTKPQYCNATYEYGKTHKGSRYASYSCLEVVFFFERQITYHLVQTYVPSGAIVAISWVSFWIDPAAVPARVSLSFTTLLTLTTMGSGVRFSLPAVSYAKAIDHWFFTCMFFVFAALLEFAVCNSYMRRGQSYDKRAEMMELKSSRHNDNGVCAPLTGMTTNIIQSTGDYYRKRAGQVDRLCRIVFPSGFLLFNLFYWLYFGSLFRAPIMEMESKV